MKLYELTRDIQEVNALIDDGTLELSEVTDTLDGMKLAVKQKGQNITALVLNEEADIEALKQAEQRIAQRRKAKQSKIEWLKDYLLENMLANGIVKIECPDFEVAISKCPPKVELIPDVEMLLHDQHGERFMRTKTVVSIDKKALKEALQSGEEISGARLVQGDRLRFK